MKTMVFVFLGSFLTSIAVQAGESTLQNAADHESSSTSLLVVPPTYVGVPGTAGFLGPLANAPRTYQLLIHDSLLTTIVGRRLSAISWRLSPSASAAWPAADVSHTNYDIYLSGSVPPSARSLTFSANVVGTQTQVRTGSLTTPSGSYPFGGSPNAFGPEIRFTTSWQYQGGHLLIEIRHTGFTGTSSSVDAIGTAIPGYGTAFSACWIGNYTGTSGSQGNFSVVRLTTDSITLGIGDPEFHHPGSYSLFQNYPNPFNPSTSITFTIPVTERVRLSVFDVLGNRVAEVVNGVMSRGQHTVTFDASRLSSGTYFYRLESGGFVQAKKLVVLR